MRIAAVGDVHLGADSHGLCRPALRSLPERADILLLAGDLTRHGTVGAALDGLDTDVTVALTHYSPISDTLHGEPREIYPFLGSYLLGEAIDRHGTDLALHGHAHAGSERGTTPGGVRVRNVAQPVLRAAYAIYQLDPAATARRDAVHEAIGSG